MYRYILRYRYIIPERRLSLPHSRLWFWNCHISRSQEQAPDKRSIFNMSCTRPHHPISGLRRRYASAKLHFFSWLQRFLAIFFVTNGFPVDGPLRYFAHKTTVYRAFEILVPWNHGAFEVSNHGAIGPWDHDLFSHGRMGIWDLGTFEVYNHGAMGLWDHDLLFNGHMDEWFRGTFVIYNHGAMGPWDRGW